MKQAVYEKKIPGYGTYVLVWSVLLLLLALTVVMSKLNPLHLAAVWSLTIAAIKAVLVLLFFMHLGYEKGYFKYTIIIPIVVLAIFMILTFSDTYLR